MYRYADSIGIECKVVSIKFNTVKVETRSKFKPAFNLKQLMLHEKKK